MFCIKCGEKLSKESKFCPKCGMEIGNKTNKAIKVEEKTADSKTPNNGLSNNSTKTGSIVLGVISILTCCTCFIPIILGIVGIMLAVKARKDDPSFKAGLILNIIGIVLVVVFCVLSVIGLIFIGLSVEGKLTHEWCCSTTDTNNCEIRLELDSDYTYEIQDKYNTLESNGSWDYDWINNTKVKGEQYKLTLDEYDYEVYIKGKEMKMYDEYDTSTPAMYCTRK